MNDILSLLKEARDRMIPWLDPTDNECDEDLEFIKRIDVAIAEFENMPEEQKDA